MFENILLERRGRVALITINRPDKLNALNIKTREELANVLDELRADAEIRVVVLTGAGEKAFAAGADIKEMAEKPAAEFYSQDFFSRWTSHLVKTTRKPWIAAVNGFALGGGCELAMMADFIIASENAKFGQPEIKLGVGPGMGGSQRLTKAVGKAKAMEMCLTGRMMGAEEAERSGLVARVVPLASLVEEALKTATEIAAIKVAAPNVALKIVDRAIQVFGGMGVTDDVPLAAFYAHLRTLRLADGPDEVHKRAIARRELRPYVKAQAETVPGVSDDVLSARY